MMILYDKFLIQLGSQYFIPRRITVGTYSTQPRHFTAHLSTVCMFRML